MSATIDLDSFRNYFKVPSIKFGEVHAGDMTSFNIKEHWLAKKPTDWKTAAIYIVINILETTMSGHTSQGPLCLEPLWVSGPVWVELGPLWVSVGCAWADYYQ